MSAISEDRCLGCWSLRLDRLNSFVRRWDSSSKTLRLTVGSGVFNWRAAAETLPVSIGVTDVAFFWAARRQLLVANVVDPLAYAFGTIC